MKKVVVLVSAFMLFAGLTFAQTPQVKDQKTTGKKEVVKPAEKKEVAKPAAKPAEKKEAVTPAAKPAEKKEAVTPAAKPATKPAEKKAPEKK
ncbi:MAG: hypothetical protein NTY96_10875 [Bacteroidetes bacterium]|nr:hypothetical protein [Bacteroidota bacterium]